MRLYKCFNGPLHRASGAYGHGTYDLSELPATFPRLKGRARSCRWGYHVCRRRDVIRHLGNHIAEVEVPDCTYGDSEGITLGPLTVVRLYERWSPQVQRLFAADCAASVQHLNDDPRVSQAIRTGRLAALGRATNEELAAALAALESVAVAAGKYIELTDLRTPEDVARELEKEST